MENMDIFGNTQEDTRPFHSESAEMTGLPFNVCPKCTGRYLGKSATSRLDGSAICPLCGHREALQASVGAGILSERVATDTFERIKDIETKHQLNIAAKTTATGTRISEGGAMIKKIIEAHDRARDKKIKVER